jgi:sortase A
MTMRRALVLLWLERSLLAAGLVPGAWCGMTLIEARYYSTLPVPAPALKGLPGDRGSTDPGPMAVGRGQWVARLEAPSIGLAATVLEGSDDRTLARAAGHIEETALPGQRGNVGIAGHRDTTFRPIRGLKTGDPLRLTTTDRVFEYRVTSTIIVEPEDVHVLAPTAHPTLTLVTCYPFTYLGHAPKRYIVKADLVSARLSGPEPPPRGQESAAAKARPRNGTNRALWARFGEH